MIRRMIFIIFAICWMMVIFHFSSKNADESTKDSNAAGMLVGRIVYSDFNVWPEEEQQVFAERWDYPIRKTAHMTEYAILLAFVAAIAVIVFSQGYDLTMVDDGTGNDKFVGNNLLSSVWASVWNAFSVISRLLAM